MTTFASIAPDKDYAAHWSLTDFYPESKKALQELIETPGNFFVDTWGCKKELNYAKIDRTEDRVRIWVQNTMDEDLELIDDALYHFCDVEEDIPEDLIEEIADLMVEYDITSDVETEAELPVDATFDDIVEKIDELEQANDNELEEMFERLGEIAKEAYTRYYAGLVDSDTES